MARQNLISTDEFCIHHNIEFSFIRNLCDFGLLETVTVEKIEFIKADQLERLERMLRLHRELDINVEGIDTIDHLLDRLHDLQTEVTSLKNRLRLYEDID
ncbi:chaperone modulator CbpM [Daejeonella lutea]|uniref:MerR HTH family regulatory protein n=1 Tax=Daejeonella lutea TaxID=572036 RepID=A0A1T5EUU5_9SPHI|nr:chaperone modulator CbpM [Daejeonella lutea]SKB87618.1 MerR HTH family regulatory protein [Daejeonella lutea]